MNKVMVFNLNQLDAARTPDIVYDLLGHAIHHGEYAIDDREIVIRFPHDIIPDCVIDHADVVFMCLDLARFNPENN